MKAQSCHFPKNSKRNDSKPEVEIDIVSTPFETLWPPLKYAVLSLHQVAPQVP